MVHPKLSSASAYALTLGATAAVAFLLPFLRRSYHELMLMPFLLSVLIGAAAGGLGQGLLATFLGAVLGVYLAMPPLESFSTQATTDWLHISVFLIVGLAVTLYAHLSRIAFAERESDARQQLQDQILRRQQTEEQLHAERNRFVVTLTSIGDAAILTDSEGRIDLLNPTAQSLTGWTEGEAHGQPLKNVFRIINETTRKPVENPAEKVLRTGAVVGLANHTLLIAKDGREIPISDSAAPIRGANGRLLGVILIFRDVGQERRAQSALAESEAFYRAIGESIPYGAWICEPSGDIRYLSDSFLQMTGMKLDERIHASWTSRVHPEDLQPILDHWRHCVKTGAFWDFEYRIRSADGSYRCILSRGVPVRNAEGKVTAWAGMNLDITEMKKLQDELIRKTEKLTAADRQKDEFLAMLAHELRNPLAPIMKCDTDPASDGGCWAAIRLGYGRYRAADEAHHSSGGRSVGRIPHQPRENHLEQATAGTGDHRQPRHGNQPSADPGPWPQRQLIFTFRVGLDRRRSDPARASRIQSAQQCRQILGAEPADLADGDDRKRTSRHPGA